MTRSVHCLLVGTGAAASRDAIAEMTSFVQVRFGIAPVALEDAHATEPEVMGALDAAAKGCRAGGLFILMFSGHGGFDHQKHFWQLSRGQLTDEALLHQVGHFDPDVEIFIISDCCYGAGMLRAGVARSIVTRGGSAQLQLGHGEKLILQRELEERLRAFTSRAAKRLRGQRASGDKSIPAAAHGNVVLAAATDWLMVRTNLQNRFVRALCGAVPKAAKYKELREKMISIMQPDGQSNWIVDAEPASALELQPLVP
jgi:hypothetical protein